MTYPTVCAVMLTRDRPAMARRAVECFRAQTYANKRLLVVETGRSFDFSPQSENEHYRSLRLDQVGKYAIGEMRNVAAQLAGQWGDAIMAHFDDDDWSHPNRIEEQVELLQSTGADCVGYREMLFWDERNVEWTTHPDSCTCGTCGPGHRAVVHGPVPPRAWLYADPYRPVGTSLCYWRRTWEQHPFPDLPQPRRQPNPDMRGEDVEWLRGVNFMAVDCFGRPLVRPAIAGSDPRMIARIHGGNSSGSYAELGKSAWWRRVPEWDAYCLERMAL